MLYIPLQSHTYDCCDAAAASPHPNLHLLCYLFGIVDLTKI